MFTPDLINARWTKSSFSANGEACVELAHGTTWAKSSFSHEGSCVELTQDDAWVAMRDSKNPDGPALVFDHAAMSQFLADVKSGAFDLV